MIAIEDDLEVWAANCRAALKACSNLFQPFFQQQSDEHRESDQVLGQLAMSCTLTSFSALALIDLRSVWDADMLVRSVVEGTCKLAFMCTRDEKERKKRVNEYWHDWREISRISRHERAQEILSVGNVSADQRRPLQDLLLPEEQLAALKARYTSKVRNALNQRWSLTRMLGTLAASDVPGGHAFRTLAHGYGMSSHLLHQDGDSVAIRWERAQRSEERERTLEATHAFRVLSDILSMAVYRVAAARRLKGIDLEPVAAVWRKYSMLKQVGEQAHQRWYRVEYGDADGGCNFP